MLHILKSSHVFENYGTSFLSYFGENTGYHHTITQDDGTFDLFVEDLNENGDPFEKFFFSFSSLSAAIARIEAIENGEEV